MAELPVIGIESEQTVPYHAIEQETTSDYDQAMAAVQNANLVDEKNTNKTPELVDEVI